jgi:hypothetical protein
MCLLPFGAHTPTISIKWNTMGLLVAFGAFRLNCDSGNVKALHSAVRSQFSMASSQFSMATRKGTL